jgi:uncharacterized protein YunC (DUF1805 family)
VKSFEQHVIKLPKANLVVVSAKNGYIMCGLLNMETAERLGQAACMVTGVKTAEDAISASVKACTSEARKLGVKEGMSGGEALQLMNS